jgi:hypothetical protein
MQEGRLENMKKWATVGGENRHCRWTAERNGLLPLLSLQYSTQFSPLELSHSPELPHNFSLSLSLHYEKEHEIHSLSLLYEKTFDESAAGCTIFNFFFFVFRALHLLVMPLEFR